MSPTLLCTTPPYYCGARGEALLCSIGYLCTGNGTQTPCQPHRTSTPGSTSCEIFCADCVGGSRCAEGYADPQLQCVNCAKTHYKFSGSCIPCPATSTHAKVLIVGACVLVVCLVVKKLSRAPPEEVVVYTMLLSLLVHFWQFSAIGWDLDIQWPSAFAEMTNTMGAEIASKLGVHFGCQIHLTHYEKLALTFVGPYCGFLVLCALSSVIVCVAIHPRTQARNHAKSMERTLEYTNRHVPP